MLLDITPCFIVETLLQTSEMLLPFGLSHWVRVNGSDCHYFSPNTYPTMLEQSRKWPKKGQTRSDLFNLISLENKTTLEGLGCETNNTIGVTGS